MGERLVAWCDGDGNVCAAEATCAHLGADLSRTGGGRVCDGRLVCPMHGFEYDARGVCVATPSAAAPRAARLRVYETDEISGLVFGWWGIDGRSPQWRLPAIAPRESGGSGESGWSGLRIAKFRFRGHPQETTENSVDLAHLSYVHGYENVRSVNPELVEEHHLTTGFEFQTTRKIAKIARITLEFSAEIQVVGLGYSFVETFESTIGIDMRLWILVTPIDGTLVEMTQVSQIREIRNPKRWFLGLGFLPVQHRAPIMNKWVSAFQRQDIRQDVAIWDRKEYRSRPRLSGSDGEIMAYRAYCAQFYSTASDDPVSDADARASS